MLTKLYINTSSQHLESIAFNLANIISYILHTQRQKIHAACSKDHMYLDARNENDLKYETIAYSTLHALKDHMYLTVSL